MEEEFLKSSIDKFLEQLESYCISLTDRLDDLDKLESDYNYVLNVINSLNNSKIEYSKLFFSLSLDDKNKFKSVLSRIVKDSELVDSVINELINLYYLDVSGLIELDSVIEQKNNSFDIINKLLVELNKFILNMDIDSKTREKNEIKNRVSDVSELGNSIEDGVINPIDDVSFIDDIFNIVDLDDSEKEAIIFYLFSKNLDSYHRILDEKDSELSNKIEDSYKEVEENIVPVPKISSEDIQKIRDLLSNRDILERIVRIVNKENEVGIDDNGNGFTPLDQIKIEESISIVEDEIITRMLEDEALTIEDALGGFFNDFDDTNEVNLGLLSNLFDDSEMSDKSLEEQDKIINEGFELFNKNKKLIKSLTLDDRDRVYDYMFTTYKEVVNRKEVFKNIAHVSERQLLSEAIYEISILKRLYENTEMDEDSFKTIKSKLSRRMEEILSSLKEIIEVKEEVNDTKKTIGNLFLLMHGRKSFLEEDTDVSNYPEVLDILKQLQDRANNKMQTTSGNYILKEFKKYGVLFNTKGKVKVFFIPVGRSDSIVIGEEIADNEHYEKIVNRIKKNKKKIEQLKEDLSDSKTYEEMEIESIKRVKELFDKLSITDEMVEASVIGDEDSSSKETVK